MQTRLTTQSMQRVRPLLTALKLSVALGLGLYVSLSHAVQPITYYEYDANGNLTKITDGLGNATVQQYDALNRMNKQQQPNPATAGQLGEITMQYNAIDQMTAVTDPRNLITSYNYNALNELLSMSSPDTGNTTNTYDEVGNVLTKQDAKGQVTTYLYDALNRLTLITFADNQTISYGYDQGVNGVGRLHTITDATGVTTYAYDVNGRITEESRQLNGFVYKVSYVYNVQGQLTDTYYPTGIIVRYTRDSLGRISQVSMIKNDQEQVLVSNVTYQPFGGIQSLTYGNGRVSNRSYDVDNRMTGYQLGNKTINIAYDAASRIESLNNPANNAELKQYGYDNLDRLTGASTANTGKSYAYDLTGNRTNYGVGASSYSNTIDANSNKLTAVSGPTAKTNSFDANGSIVDDTVNQYSYDARGRLTQTTTPQGAVNYGVNALGQRVTKTINSATTLYHYDINGQLIAETDDQGNVKEETIYLGNMPIAVIK